MDVVDVGFSDVHSTNGALTCGSADVVDIVDVVDPKSVGDPPRGVIAVWSRDIHNVPPHIHNVARTSTTWLVSVDVEDFVGNYIKTKLLLSVYINIDHYHWLYIKGGFL